MKAVRARARGMDSDDSVSESSAKMPRGGSSPPGSGMAPPMAVRKKKKKKSESKMGSVDSLFESDLLACGEDEVVVVGGLEGSKKSLMCDEVVVSGGLGGCEGKLSTNSVKKVVGGKGKNMGPVAALKAITSELVSAVLDKGVSGEVCKDVIDCSGKYEAIVMELMLEVERLKGRLETYEKGGLPVQRGLVGSSATAAPAPVNPVSKPVETWSVVVRSKDAAATPNQVVSKVVGEIAPALAVRVHEVKPIKSGGAIIRTPSVAERDKIVANRKFKEVGLDVVVNEKRPRVKIFRVPSEISPDEFMGELFELNLKEVMSLETFKKNVKIVSEPWSAGSEASNVVLIEGNDVAVNTLLRNDRCYIKWFAFRVSSVSYKHGCFKCCGLDHQARECRFKDSVCRRCGQMGHMARQCSNAVSCRNCLFKGKPSSHLMLSEACPLYSAHVARMEARH